MSNIGVFDSGIGGLSVAQAIEKAFPRDTVIFASDREHMPYGDKSPEVVLGFVVPILDDLAAQGCDVIVIACNTVTTNHIKALRERLRVPLIGIEPMVKTAAAASKSKIIAVCATPATLASPRYAELKTMYAQGMNVLEPDCSGWAYMIENNQINEEQLERQIDTVCRQGADVIVLGCTHYHWIEPVIVRMAAGRAAVIQPEESVIAHLKQMLGRG